MVQCIATVPATSRGPAHRCNNAALIGEVHCEVHATEKEKARRRTLGVVRDGGDKKSVRERKTKAVTTPPKTATAHSGSGSGSGGSGGERNRSPKTGSRSSPRVVVAPRSRPPVAVPSPSPRLSARPETATTDELPPDLLALVLDKLGAGNAIAAARANAFPPALHREVVRQVTRCGADECARHWRQLFLGYYRAQLEKLLRPVVLDDVERADSSRGGYQSTGFARYPLAPEAIADAAAAADEYDAVEEEDEEEKKIESTTTVLAPQRAARCRPEWCLAETAPIERLLETEIGLKRDLFRQRRVPAEARDFHFAFRFDLGRRTTETKAATASSKPSPPEPRAVPFNIELRLYEDHGKRGSPLQLAWRLELPRAARDPARLYTFVPTEDAIANAARALVRRVARETQTDLDADAAAGREWIEIAETAGWSHSLFWRAVPLVDAHETTRQLAQLIRALVDALAVRTVHVFPEALRRIADDTLRAYFFQVFAAFPGLDVYVQHTDTRVGRQVARAVAEFPLANIHAVVVR